MIPPVKLYVVRGTWLARALNQTSLRAAQETTWPVTMLFICGGSRTRGKGALHMEVPQTETGDSRRPGTWLGYVLNSAPSQEAPDSLNPIGQWVPPLGAGWAADLAKALQGWRLPSRPCRKRDGCCQSPWPSSGGLSWPKRDRYNSVLEDKQNKLVNTLVNFARLKKELRSWEIPQSICWTETTAM